MFDDKVLMITAGAGSFGHAVLRLFLDTAVRKIRIFFRDEKKQEGVRIGLAKDRAKFYIGDVRDYASHKTHRLDVPGIKALLKLDYIKEQLHA